MTDLTAAYPGVAYPGLTYPGYVPPTAASGSASGTYNYAGSTSGKRTPKGSAAGAYNYAAYEHP